MPKMTRIIEGKRFEPRPIKVNKFTTESLTLQLISGIPEEDGWYLVKLIPGHTGDIDKHYDVDYCRAKGKFDGGGREWCKWYSHNISHYAKLP